MIIDKVQARELGEAIIDAADAVEARKQDQHIVMVGEKAADHILGRPPLGRANDIPFNHPNWKTDQR